MQPDPLPRRFAIRWDSSAYPSAGYRVSIPNYDGGEVVTAEAYDELLEALRAIWTYLSISGDQSHQGFGDACGQDACVLCLAAQTAKSAVATAERAERASV